MLGLRSETDRAWVEAARGDLDGLLSDHAHCELKAAQSALSVVARFGGEYPHLVPPLTDLAQEESRHFAEVHERIAARSGQLAAPDVDPYVQELQRAAKRDHPAVPILLDRLVVAALIEARSCERFRLLSEHLGLAELEGFYRELMASEARHYRLFCDLAAQCFGAEAARARLATLAEREAEIAQRLPLEPKIHG
jgi:tRNA-(ms[2]io[6]A)-hydroxylase